MTSPSAPAVVTVLPPAPAPGGGAILRAETAAEAAAVEALNDRAFGPGRFAKVSYAVRELARFRPDLSFCAYQDGALVGSVRQSEVAIGGKTVLFLGPFAVDASARGKGVGAALIERAIAAGAEAGFPLVVLVGDLPLFARHGFATVPAERIVLPRPVDPRRVLWRPLREGGETDVAGPVGPPER
jgi:predicted N-acetyltransferase YhbS